MKFIATYLILAFCVAASAFTSTSTYSPFTRAPIGTRKTTAIGAAAGGAAKKKRATKKKTKTKKKSAAKVEVETVRKAEFVSKVAEKTGMTKIDSEAALAAVLETITEEVSSGKKVSMLGFGTFKLTHRTARKGRNPKTGEEIDIKASNSPSFSAGKAFKERCNE